jgi:hypothetical protein
MPTLGGGGSSASHGSRRTNSTTLRPPHIQADNLEGDQSGDERKDTPSAEVDRSELRIAELSEPVAEYAEPAFTESRAEGVWRQRDTWIRRRADLDAREEILVFKHVSSPSAKWED